VFRLNSTLPEVYEVYFHEPLDIPCGVLYGNYTNVTVEWEVQGMWTEGGAMMKRIVLQYTSAMNMTRVRREEVYSYDPVTTVLHITNFNEFFSDHVSVTCIVIRTADSKRLNRTVNVTISLPGKLCCQLHSMTYYQGNYLTCGHVLQFISSLLCLTSK